MNKFKSFLLFLLAFLLTHIQQPVYASMIAPADVEWVRTNTKHFHIIHDKKQQDLGLYYAQVAEVAYYNLSTLFATLPEEVTIVISDNTDTSNGNATVFPYPLINVYPVLVGQQDGLSESGEWGKELLTHELTHVAQLYPYSSMGYKILRTMFGSIISPNLLMPNWWKEGMAVEVETQMSPQGRSRSYLQDAQIRSYVTSHKLNEFTLAEANETLVTWPYGNRQYFFGSMIMSQISKEKKPTALGQIVLDQSYMIPYIVNPAVEGVTNKDYALLYEETLTDYTANSQKQIEILKTVPLSVTKIINPDLLMSKSVQFDDRLEVLGLIATTDMKTELQFYKKQNNSEFTRLDLGKGPASISGNLGFFSFHPTEAKVLFSKTHQVNLQQSFSDLFIYDMVTYKTEKLTDKERARDPVYSPDGKFALFISTAHGLTELKEMQMANKKIKSLVKADHQSRINSYAYKNSNEIFYTVRNQMGEQKLWSFNIVTLKATSIPAPKQIRFLKFKNEKLYFTSVENGVQNIYSAKVNGSQLSEMTPITHLMTGALSFDVDEKNNQIYSTLVGENGPVVASTTFLPTQTKLPPIENAILARYQDHVDPAYKMTTTQDEYSSWPYIYPHYWIPFISTNVTGNGVLYQALTSGADPIGNHAYTAQLNYDSYSNKVGFAATYMNTQLPWAWNALALQTQQLFGIDAYVRKNIYSVGLFPDTYHLNEDLRVSVGAIINQTEDIVATTNHAGGYLQIAFNNIEQKSNHYYPMTGVNLLAKYQNLADQDHQISSRFGNYSQALFSMTSYNHLFLPKDHTLMLKLDGLYTFEDVSNRFGTSNLSLPVDNELIPLFMIRGYQAGQFLGTQMVSVNLEYRFPVINLSSGTGTTPFFVKYLTGGIVADGLAVKGFGYNKNQVYEPLTLTDQIFSAGIEARLDTTVGYILPVKLIYGVYAPMTRQYSKDNIVTGLSIQMTGF